MQVNRRAKSVVGAVEFGFGRRKGRGAVRNWEGETKYRGRGIGPSRVGTSSTDAGDSAAINLDEA